MDRWGFEAAAPATILRRSDHRTAKLLAKPALFNHSHPR